MLVNNQLSWNFKANAQTTITTKTTTAIRSKVHRNELQTIIIQISWLD